MVRTIVRSIVVATAMFVFYFTAPFSRGRLVVSFWLLVGLVGVGLLVAWQVRGIIRSPYPRLRAVEAVSMTLPLFLVVCASTHYLIGIDTPGSYTQVMTRMDAMYFVVTVFATVGFGDIAPVSETARIATTLQMVGDLVLVGVIARILLGAIQEGLRRRQEDGSPGGVDVPPGVYDDQAGIPPGVGDDDV